MLDFMRSKRLILTAACAFVTVVAAVTAIVIFRNEIAEFFVVIKDRVDINRFRRNGEYADYAEM